MLPDIAPSSFYKSSRQPFSTEKVRITQAFPRQSLAFEFFDSIPLIERRSKGLKVYSFESNNDGRRKFLVADWNTFLTVYLGDSATAVHGHIYEIIREGYNCHCYFDLEYPFNESNSHVDGDYLTAKLINTILWKIYEVYGLALNETNVIVLDSTSSTKFSKHVILKLPMGLLFANNAAVGSLVSALMLDMTTLKGDCRLPKTKFDDFWIVGSDEGKRVCFIDTSVYSRNRAFRVFGCSKFNKSNSIKLSAADAKLYKGLVVTPNDDKLDRRKLYEDALSTSFVVPLSVVCSSSGHGKSGEGTVLESCGALVRERLLHANVVQHVSDFDGKYSPDHIPAVVIPSISIPGLLPGGTWTERVVCSSSTTCSAVVYTSHSVRTPSPLPTLDKFVESKARRGGQIGIITSWNIYSGRGLTGEFPVLKIRYQIGCNRFCDNVGRSHKSNGIMFEVDLQAMQLYQLCWDPDCRGFRSPCLAVPLVELGLSTNTHAELLHCLGPASHHTGR